jgi:hypothetical protein
MISALTNVILTQNNKDYLKLYQLLNPWISGPLHKSSFFKTSLSIKLPSKSNNFKSLFNQKKALEILIFTMFVTCTLNVVIFELIATNYTVKSIVKILDLPFTPPSHFFSHFLS